MSCTRNSLTVRATTRRAIALGSVAILVTELTGAAAPPHAPDHLAPSRYGDATGMKPVPYSRRSTFDEGSSASPSERRPARPSPPLEAVPLANTHSGILGPTSWQIETPRPFSFPFNAAHFAEREYVFTGFHGDEGVQQHGFDFGTLLWRDDDGVEPRFEEDRWSALDADVSQSLWESAPANHHFRIYRRPVRAMADGEVVGCWRNAPENPRPFSGALGDSFTVDGFPVRDDGSNITPCEDSPWLHPMLCERRMPGGGNHLWIRHDSGSHALYAHFKPDTVPEGLCPHDEPLFAQPARGGSSPDIAAEAAVGSGARVAAGDYLGEVGNSGASSAPHLHVHVEKDGKSRPIPFERGLSAPFSWSASLTDAARDANFSSFAGTTVPRDADISALIWPPRSTWLPFDRDGVPASRMQSWMDHLDDSGYTPGLVTCAVEDGEVSYDLIGWQPPATEVDWYMRFGLGNGALASEIERAERHGYAVTSVYTCNTATLENSVVVFTR